MRVSTDCCKPRRRVSCLGRLIAPHPPSPYDFHCFVNADWKVKQTLFGSCAFLSILSRSWTKSLPCMSMSHWFANEKIYIERFHSRGQHLCQFIGTKRKRFYIRKEFNSYKIGLEHQHGCRFIVLEHHRGPYDPTTATPMKKSLKNRIRVFWNFFALIQATRLLESREVSWNWREGTASEFRER